MLEFIRKHQKWVLVIIALIIIPSFTFLGVSGYQNMTNHSIVLAKVGKTPITKEMFENQWRQSLNNMIQSLNDQQARLPEDQRKTIDPKELNTPQNRQMVFQSMVNGYVLTEAVSQGYYKGTPLLVANYIKSNPMFHDEQGQFSRQKYDEFLSVRGLTPAHYESYLASLEIPREQVVQAPSIAFHLSNQLKAEIAKELGKSYTIALKLIDAQSFERDVKVNDEDLQAWYDLHKEEFKIPEYVNVDYILLNEQSAIRSVAQPTDNELRQFFEANQHLYKKGEDSRRISMLVVSPEDAKQLYDVLKEHSEQFESMVQEHSIDESTRSLGGVLGQFKSTDREHFPEFSKAFDVTQTTILEPIQLPQGEAIVRVDDIKIPVQESFEEAKPALLEEALKQKASAQFSTMLDVLQNEGSVYQDGLQNVAQKLKLSIQTTDGVALGGLLPLNRLPEGSVQAPSSDIFQNLSVRNAVFGTDVLEKKQNTHVIALGTSEYTILHVNHVEPERIPDFDEVKDLVRQAYIKEQSFVLAKSYVDHALDEFNHGQSPIQFAAPIEVNRLLIQEWPSEALSALRDVSKESLPAYIHFENEKGYTLAKVIHIGESKDNQAIIQYLLNNVITQSLSRIQTDDSLMALRKELGVELDQAMIEQVVNTISEE